VAEQFPRALDLLLDSPDGTVMSLNVPDRPLRDQRELRVARLARFGTVQARVDHVEDGALHMREMEIGAEPEEGTDGALLATGCPTLTPLRSVGEEHETLDELASRLTSEPLS
jgi:5'-nucleotidase